MDGIKISVGSSVYNPNKELPCENVRQISAKLHDEYDRELKQLIQKVPKRERSQLYRKAVFKYLKGETS